jgi:hypothetical protein
MNVEEKVKEMINMIKEREGFKKEKEMVIYEEIKKNMVERIEK